MKVIYIAGLLWASISFLVAVRRENIQNSLFHFPFSLFLNGLSRKFPSLPFWFLLSYQSTRRRWSLVEKNMLGAPLNLYFRLVCSDVKRRSYIITGILMCCLPFQYCGHFHIAVLFHLHESLSLFLSLWLF